MDETNNNTAKVRLLSIKDVTDLLRISERSVNRLVDRGELPQPARIGRSVRWRNDQIIDFLMSLTGSSESKDQPKAG